MAKQCLLTGDMVLYLDCLECDEKKDCKAGKIQGNIPDTEQIKENNNGKQSEHR